MGFTRLVQCGRVALVNYGPEEGKLVVIIDVIDHNRCVVYGPTSGVPRQVLTYKRLSLTDIKIELGRGARAKTADAAWTSADVEGKWAATSRGSRRPTPKGLEVGVLHKISHGEFINEDANFETFGR